MQAKTLIVTILAIVVPTLTLAGLSHAKNGGSQVRTEVKAELDPCCGDPEPEANGEAERETRSRSGVIQRDEFKAKVEIPVDPSSALGITDAATAAAADVRLILEDDTGTPYAECFLQFDGIETNGEVEAKYKVDLRKRLKKGTLVLQQRKGTCDTDLVTGGIQVDIPDVQDGDTATAAIVNGGTTPFLEGEFEED